MGRRRQAAWGPRLEEGCGREPPRVPTVPAHPGQGAVGAPKLEKPRGRRCPQSWKSQEAASVPSQRARKRVASQQKTPTRRQTETNRKTGVSAGLRGKRPFTSPSSPWEPGEHSRQPPGRAAGGAKGGGSHPQALLRNPGGAPTPARAGQCWRGARLPPQPGSVGSWANGHY